MNQTPTIRAAKLQDAGVVQAIAAKAQQEAYKGLIPTQRLADFTANLAANQQNIQQWERRIKKSIDSPRTHIAKVMVVDGNVVGFFNAVADEHMLHIKKLYIDPAYQGQSLGSKLITAGIQTAPRPITILHVLAENTPAVAFYQRQGFKIAGKPDWLFYGAKRYKMVRQH